MKNIKTFWQTLDKQPLYIQKEAINFKKRLKRYLDKETVIKISKICLTEDFIINLANERKKLKVLWKSASPQLIRIKAEISPYTLSFTLPNNQFAVATNMQNTQQTIVLNKTHKKLNLYKYYKIDWNAQSVNKPYKLCTFNYSDYIRLFGWPQDIWVKAVINMLSSGSKLLSPTILYNLKKANPNISLLELQLRAREDNFKLFIPDKYWLTQSKFKITDLKGAKKFSNLLKTNYPGINTEPLIKSALNGVEWLDFLELIKSELENIQAQFYLWDYTPKQIRKIHNIAEALKLTGIDSARLYYFAKTTSQTQIATAEYILTKTKEIPFNPDFYKNYQLAISASQAYHEVLYPALKQTLSDPALEALKLFNYGWIKNANCLIEKLSANYLTVAIKEHVKI